MIKKICSRYFSNIDSVPDVLAGSYFPSLDGFRALAVIIVVLMHYNAHLQSEFLDAVFKQAAVGVYIFFVLSGFLITTLLLKERIKYGVISLRKFYLRRFLRIIPLAYLYLLVIGVLNYYLHLGVTTAHFLLSGLFLLNFFQFFHVPFYTYHYWSLSVEEQFYIITPVILKIGVKGYRIFAPALLCFTFVARFMLDKYNGAFAWKFLFDLTRNLDGLLIGSLFSILIFTRLIPWVFIKKNKVFINLILFPLIFILNRDMGGVVGKIFFNHTFYSVLIAILIISNLHESADIFYKVLNNSIVKYIGMMSYSIYIWQQLFASDVFANNHFVSIVCLIIVSYISYNYYEKYFIGLKRQLKSA